MKLFHNLTGGFGEEDILRISSCTYSARSPHSPELCLWPDQNFANKFWKGSPKEHSCEIISKSDQQFLRRRFFKNCLKNSISLLWQPEFLMESNSVFNFWRGPPKEHSCQVWSNLALQFGRRSCLKKLLMTYDGHITTLKAPLEHVVLWWAKKEQNAGYKHFLLFPQPHQQQNQLIGTIHLFSANVYNLVQSKIILSGNELTLVSQGHIQLSAWGNGTLLTILKAIMTDQYLKADFFCSE